MQVEQCVCAPILAVSSLNDFLFLRCEPRRLRYPLHQEGSPTLRITQILYSSDKTYLDQTIVLSTEQNRKGLLCNLSIPGFYLLLSTSTIIFCLPPLTNIFTQPRSLKRACLARRPLVRHPTNSPRTWASCPLQNLSE